MSAVNTNRSEILKNKLAELRTMKSHVEHFLEFEKSNGNIRMIEKNSALLDAMNLDIDRLTEELTSLGSSEGVMG